MKKLANQEKFSNKLEIWLKGNEPKTAESLSKTFGTHSFAVVVLILMVIPALPLPTGGITHIFEVIAMLLSLELIAGFDKIWLPGRLKNVKLALATGYKAIPVII